MRRRRFSSVGNLRSWITRSLLLLAFVIVSAVTKAQTSVRLGTDATKFVLNGTIVNADGMLKGKAVIEGDVLTCVATACADPPGATQITVTNGYIFPGFIDAHNHVAYNILPKWSPPKIYQRRSQWQASSSYKAFKKPYDKNKKTLFCEMVKYGEIKAMLSGVTTIEGTSPGSTCAAVLVRSAGKQNQLGL